MGYNFDEVIERRGTDSIKWNGPDLPMWIADMDFRTAPEILEAMEQRLRHGVFGYSIVPDTWADAYCGWWRERHGFPMEREWLKFCSGVMPAINALIRRFTGPGDCVIIQTPVYNAFFGTIENNGRRILENPLIYENGAYRMDLEDLDRKLADPQAAMLLLCNPHNPIGKRWDRDTLAQVGELAERHGVLVVSDEIHCELTLPGCDYTPYASASETCRRNSITCLAPTKAFNLASLHTAAVCVPDPALREKLDLSSCNSVDAFSCPAAIAAFTKGGPWLDALRAYLADNRRTAADCIRERLPQTHLVDGDATYLLWLDISALGRDSRTAAEHLQREAGLRVSAGAGYGDDGFLRINIACPRVTLLEGLDRLCRGLNSLR